MSKIYEHNFKRLMRLLPGLNMCSIGQRVNPAGDEGLQVQIIESHKYTTVIKISQALPGLDYGAVMPIMTVRVYHDAHVAEVLSYQQSDRFLPKYEYPNPQMRQVREKQRVNEFLGEWLEHSLFSLYRSRVTV